MKKLFYTVLTYDGEYGGDQWSSYCGNSHEKALDAYKEAQENIERELESKVYKTGYSMTAVLTAYDFENEDEFNECDDLESHRKWEKEKVILKKS